jgi:hypothetical protein
MPVVPRTPDMHDRASRSSSRHRSIGSARPTPRPWIDWARAARYRCYLGHVATAREILDDSGERLETALWSAVRALRDRAATYETMAGDALRQDHKVVYELYRQRARDAMSQAELARRFLLDIVEQAHA